MYGFLHIVTIIIQGTFVISHASDSKLPIARSFIVLCEMARFDMKMHSYFREKLLYGNGENSYSKFIPFHLENKFLEAQTPIIIKLPISEIQNFRPNREPRMHNSEKQQQKDHSPWQHSSKP